MSAGIKASLALAGLIDLSASRPQPGTESPDRIGIHFQADATPER